MDHDIDKPVAGRGVLPEVPVERKAQVCERPVESWGSVRVEMKRRKKSLKQRLRAKIFDVHLGVLENVGAVVNRPDGIQGIAVSEANGHYKQQKGPGRVSAPRDSSARYRFQLLKRHASLNKYARRVEHSLPPPGLFSCVVYLP